MKKFSRRQFIGTGLAAIPLTGLVMKSGLAQSNAFPLGCQSYSFRHFDFNGAIVQLKALGLNQMEFFSGHLSPDPDQDGLEDVMAAIKAAGVVVPCFGVESMTADENHNRQRFEFGKRIGLQIITAHPTPDSFDLLDQLVDEYDIMIGIHNHGPGHAYDTVEDTLSAVEGRDIRIGACLDTGHCIRSNEKPHETIRALGDRLHSLHLKDWVHGADETILGEGDIDLVEVVKALHDVNFDGPLMLEYELSPENPVPEMAQGIENWKEAVNEVMG